MSVLRIPADYDDAFSHMLGFGLASILEDAAEDRICRLWWSGRHTLMVETNDEITEMECAHIVRAHAERWNKSQWLNARGSYAGKGKTVATLSPRIGTVAGREEWVALERDRRDAIDSLQTTLDEHYIGALGEPSYWSLNRTKATPEIQQKFGASLWEMTPRNRGNEFVTMRLLKLASIVTARTAEKVHSGLFGLTNVDELAGTEDSHTPTGLKVPSRTDNARAWCALLGFSNCSVYRSVHYETSPTAGFIRHDSGGGPRWHVVLPLTEKPWTLAKYRSIMRSYALAYVGENALHLDQDSLADSTATLYAELCRRLQDQGLQYCMLFQRHGTQAKSPEYWLLRGQLIRL